MKTVKFFVVAVVVLCVTVLASTVKATTVIECQTLIGVPAGSCPRSALGATTCSVVIGGNNPVRTLAGLLSKLDGAWNKLNSTKLNPGKIAGARQKIVDYQNKVLDMFAEGKLLEGDAELLSGVDVDTSADLENDGAEDVIQCIDNIVLP